MYVQNWGSLAALLLAACSGAAKPEAPAGRVVVALTIDWEGAYISPEGLDAIEALRATVPEAPLTHFVSAAYYTKETPDPLLSEIVDSVRAGDEVAVHLHGWKSLAQASHIEPRLSPSFLTGTDELGELDEGDIGFDLDLSAYDTPGLRALVRTSHELLAKAHRPISRSFRAGGYLGSPRMLQAVHDEGLAVDSSAIDYRQVAEGQPVLSDRLHGIWPRVDTTTQPFVIEIDGGTILEMPIAAVADYATADQMSQILDAAYDRLKKNPSLDAYVVLAFHQETAAEFAVRIQTALSKVRSRPEVFGAVLFTTIQEAAFRAQASLGHPATLIERG